MSQVMKCDGCARTEALPPVNWLEVSHFGTLVTTYATDHSNKHFCSVQCLADWADDLASSEVYVGPPRET